MTPATIDTYGGEKIDAESVENPQSELGAEHYSRLAEDAAQLTRTAFRAIVSFATIAAAAPQTGAVSYAWTVWGSGASYHPAVAKTNTGTYTLTFASTYTDGLDETETVSFGPALGSVAGSTKGDAQCSTATNVVTCYTFNAAGALNDLGGGVVVTAWIR